jgi:hypothetical protein
MFEKLPHVDETYRPQVTFLGPWDEWMKKAGKYKYLYKMDTETKLFLTTMVTAARSNNGRATRQRR